MALWNNSLPSKRGSQDITNLFDRFQKEFFGPDVFKGQDGFLPKVEVKESEKKYKVCAELPGLSEKDIEVTLKDNTLVIQGEKKQEQNKDEEGFHTSEFSYGSFYRRIPLISEVNEESVKASYKDGILTINLDKSEEDKKSKRIEISH